MQHANLYFVYVLFALPICLGATVFISTIPGMLATRRLRSLGAHRYRSTIFAAEQKAARMQRQQQMGQKTQTQFVIQVR